MCGIIGIAGSEPVSAEIIKGLKKLEYRGYDSAGLAIFDNDQIKQKKYVFFFVGTGSKVGPLGPEPMAHESYDFEYKKHQR